MAAIDGPLQHYVMCVDLNLMAQNINFHKTRVLYWSTIEQWYFNSAEAVGVLLCNMQALSVAAAIFCNLALYLVVKISQILVWCQQIPFA